MFTASGDVLMAIFTSELELTDFIGAKDEGSSDDNWSYKTCKSPVKSSPPTNQHPAFLPYHRRVSVPSTSYTLRKYVKMYDMQHSQCLQ